jgi:DNA-binding IclR family transcriptional regulator
MRFSDVARELDLTQGTAHAILKTLSDRGWVSRDATTKTFELGPTLSLIAARLDAARPLAHMAADAARRLAETTDMPASVVEVVGDELIITAFESPADSVVTATANERIPYAPPFGVAFAAWDTADAQQAWITRGAAGDGELEQRLRDVLTRTRERGYDIDWMPPALAQAARAIGTLPADALPAGMRPVLDQLRVEFTSAGTILDESTGAARPVATISAPVLDSTGHAKLILGIHPLRPMTVREVETAARPLLAEVGAVGSNLSRS